MTHPSGKSKCLLAASGLGALVTLGALAGCSSAPSADPESPEPLEFVRLVHGGLCATGPCRQEVRVGDDGRWTAVGLSEPAVRGGEIPQGAASRLAAVLEDGWEALTAVPFQETCPTAYDGAETVYTVRRVADDAGSPPEERVVRELASCSWDLERPDAARVLDRLDALWDGMGLPR